MMLSLFGDGTVSHPHILPYATGQKIDKVDAPQQMVGGQAEGFAADKQREEQQGGGHACDEHAARGGDADEHTVVDKRRHATDGDEQHPGKIVGDGANHALLAGHETHERHAAKGIGYGKEQRHHLSPEEQPSDGQA